jgi:hypothetical protein
MGYPPRQGLPQEWTQPRKRQVPGVRPAGGRCGRPQSTTVVFAALLSSPYLAHRCGKTSMIRRAAASRSQPMRTSSAERYRTT